MENMKIYISIVDTSVSKLPKQFNHLKFYKAIKKYAFVRNKIPTNAGKYTLQIHTKKICCSAVMRTNECLFMKKNTKSTLPLA